MTKPGNNCPATFVRTIRPAAFAFLLALALIVTTSQVMQAQTFQVLYNFTGGADGGGPNGVAIDRDGNLYGSTLEPGNCGVNGVCGGVFKLSHRGSGWILSSLYHFRGGDDGSWPNAGVTIGPDGTLYGTTTSGGGGPCDYAGIPGCGTVYHLQPPDHVCQAAFCSWNDTVLYAFQGSNDVGNPYNDVTFDAAGNLYGAVTYAGLFPEGGGVYSLTRSQGGWTYNLLFEFPGLPNGNESFAPLFFDHSGNILGTTLEGGTEGNGVVFKMVPSGSGWSESVVYSFGHVPDAGGPFAGLISDAAGNLYGTTIGGGVHGNGAVYELSPTNGSYNYSVIYGDFYNPELGNEGPRGGLVMDAAGNLYGTTSGTGRYLQGEIFELSPSANGWTFTDLHDFDVSDGTGPQGDLGMDSNGNIYGVTIGGGAHGYGVIWEITP